MFLPSVNCCNVSLKVTFENEAFLAFRAFERPLHCVVEGNVPFQNLLTLESFLTQSTTQWCFKSVNPDM